MSPRESIRMTGDEIADLLRTRRTVVLATRLPDGHPEATIVRSRYDDGALTVLVDDATRKVIDADDRVCCAVEVSPSYYDIRGVSAHGRAVVAPDGALRVPVDDTTSFDFGKIRQRPS